MDHKAYMYVVECRDGSYYTGYTTDVKRRLAVHNSDGTYTPEIQEIYYGS